jgi:hypothetical protein
LTPSARSGNLAAGDGTKNGLPGFKQRTGAIDLKKIASDLPAAATMAATEPQKTA